MTSLHEAQTISKATEMIIGELLGNSYVIILNGIAFTLIGVTNMLSAIGLAIILLTVSGFLDTLGGVAHNYNVTIPTFTTYLGVGWGFTILQLIAGFVALFAGIAILTKPKEVK